LKENLEKVINDKARKIHIRGKTAIVPLKFDKDGEIASVDSRIFKRLSLTDLRFLKVWKEENWDISKAGQRSGLENEKVERLVRRLSCFREEDAKVKALCEIPTPSWIAAKHVENIYDGGTLEDSQHKSLSELAKIEGAYKTTANLNITQNVFNLPAMAPEIEAKLKEIAEHAITAELTDAA
jgi:hypothetical protein